MDTLPPYEIHNICRICLKNDVLVSIFSPTFLLQPIEMIEKLHIFKVQSNDSLPTMLCQSCLYRLLDAYNLQQLAEASERRLREYLMSSNSTECASFTAPATQEMCKDADSTAAIYANICDMFERQVPAQQLSMETVAAADDMLNDVEIDVSSLTRSEAEDTLSEVFVGGHISCSGTEADTLVSKLQNLPETDSSETIYTKTNETKILREKQVKRTQKTLKIPDKCLECGKVFKYSGYLESHKRIHSGEKPFKCQLCSRRFTQSGNLRLHQRTHSNERRRFQCEICAGFFTTSSNLKAHALVHRDRRDVHCQRCERSFKSERELRRHEPMHRSTKDVVCELCQKAFTKRNHLRAHLAAVHQGIRRYKCTDCDKVFGSKSNLVCHARIHSGEKPFKCKYCPWKFNQSSALARHMKKHSNSKIQQENSLKQDALLQHTFINNYLEDTPAFPHTTATPQQTPYTCLQALPKINEVALSGADTTLSSSASLQTYDFHKEAILDFSTGQATPTQTLY